MSMHSGIRAIAITFIGVCATVASASSVDRGVTPRVSQLRSFPRVMFWAWERTEDLGGLDPRQAGVAFLAATYTLNGDSVRIQPRTHPLRIDPGTPLMAVVRLEVDRTRAPQYDSARTENLGKSIGALARMPGVAALQIDFDATTSERDFYRELIDQTRRALGDTPLSVTALVSWCMNDDWLGSTSIDEAVPMLFRLGASGDGRLKALGAAGRLRASLCSTAVGVSMDEPTPALSPGRRLYIFRPTPWTPDAAQRAIREVRQWR